MRRHRLLLVLGVCALLLTPSAGGGPMVPGDPTPPVVTPHFFGTQGLNGWWVTNVTLNWTIEDPESPILETRGCDAVTLTQDTAGTSFTCYARSDGGETQVTVTIRLDKTGPVVTATPSRSPDSNGWYNHALSVGFSGTDATSGMDSCVSPQSYSGPDNANASVSGSCRDRAGNVTVKNFSLSYDATAPQVTGANASRSPDRNGWYNHTLTVTFAGTDATSGIDSCTQTSYSGPDSANASVSGVCRDRGREHELEQQLRLPVRRDRAGGHRHALAQPGRERLVQPSPDGRLQRHRRDLRGRHLLRAAELLGPGQRERLGERFLHRSRREQHAAQLRAQLRLDGAAGDGVEPVAEPGLERLVQPRVHGHVRRRRRHVRHRHVHADDVLGARRRDGHRQRHLPRPRREHEREQRLQLPVRRHRPRRDCDSGRVLPIRTAGTTMRCRSASRARMRPRGWTPACRRRTTRGPTRQNASVSGSCRDRAGNSTVKVFSLSYDATAPTVTGRDPLARARSRGLVQPRALDRLLGSGRDLGHRFVHAGELLRPRLGQRLGLRHVP